MRLSNRYSATANMGLLTGRTPVTSVSFGPSSSTATPLHASFSLYDDPKKLQGAEIMRVYCALNLKHRGLMELKQRLEDSQADVNKLQQAAEASHKDWLHTQTLIEKLMATNNEEVDILSSELDNIKTFSDGQGTQIQTLLNEKKTLVQELAQANTLAASREQDADNARRESEALRQQVSALQQELQASKENTAQAQLAHQTAEAQRDQALIQVSNATTAQQHAQQAQRSADATAATAAQAQAQAEQERDAARNAATAAADKQQQAEQDCDAAKSSAADAADGQRQAEQERDAANSAAAASLAAQQVAATAAAQANLEYMRILAEKDTATKARQAAVSAAAAAQQETYNAATARDAAVADCAAALAERESALANSTVAVTQLQAAVAERHAALEECKAANNQREAAFQTAQQAQHAQQAAEAAAAAAISQQQETAQVLLETQTAQAAAEESLKVSQQEIKQFTNVQEEASSEVRQLQGALSAAQTLLGQLQADKITLAAELLAKTELADVEAHQSRQTEVDLARTQTELRTSATQILRLSESLTEAKADAAAQVQSLQGKLQAAEASLVSVRTEQAQQVTANEKACLRSDQLLAELNVLKKEHAKTTKNAQDLTSAIKRQEDEQQHALSIERASTAMLGKQLQEVTSGRVALQQQLQAAQAGLVSAQEHVKVLEREAKKPKYTVVHQKHTVIHDVIERETPAGPDQAPATAVASSRGRGHLQPALQAETAPEGTPGAAAEGTTNQPQPSRMSKVLQTVMRPWRHQTFSPSDQSRMSQPLPDSAEATLATSTQPEASQPEATQPEASHMQGPAAGEAEARRVAGSSKGRPKSIAAVKGRARGRAKAPSKAVEAVPAAEQDAHMSAADEQRSGSAATRREHAAEGPRGSAPEPEGPQEAVAEAPIKKGRGRPSGSKIKPRQSAAPPLDPPGSSHDPPETASRSDEAKPDGAGAKKKRQSRAASIMMQGMQEGGEAGSGEGNASREPPRRMTRSQLAKAANDVNDTAAAKASGTLSVSSKADGRGKRKLAPTLEPIAEEVASKPKRRRGG